jgi:hypothetical protein
MLKLISTELDVQQELVNKEHALLSIPREKNTLLILLKKKQGLSYGK